MVCIIHFPTKDSPQNQMAHVLHATLAVRWNMARRDFLPSEADKTQYRRSVDLAMMENTTQYA